MLHSYVRTDKYKNILQMKFQVSTLEKITLFSQKFNSFDMYSFYLSGYVFIILFLKCQAKRGIVSGFGFLDFRVKESLETDKDIFLKALDTTDTLNLASEKRTSLLNTMIDRKLEVENARELSINNSYIASSEIPIRTPPLLSSRSLKHPGQLSTFSKVATGTWKVIYAPHMTKISGVFGGRFDVSYILYDDLTIESHARYVFVLPLFLPKFFAAFLTSVSILNVPLNTIICMYVIDMTFQS